MGGSMTVGRRGRGSAGYAFALALACGTFVGAPSRAGLSPQAAVASEFLARLESGRYDQAWLLLDSRTQRVTRAQVLAANAPRYDPTMVRRIAYIAYEARRPPNYVICYVDLPRRRSGTVRHVSVAVIQETAGWRVSGYSYQSVPHPACSGHV